MKILILFLISFSSMAGSYLPTSQICENVDGLTSYSSKYKCLDNYSEPCIETNEIDLIHCKVRAEKWLKELAEACTDDCQEKLEALTCSDLSWTAIKTETEVYCTKYRPEKIVIDDAKKAVKDAEKAQKIQDKIDRKTERDEVRGFIQTINESDLPVWHKKILKRIIRDLKDD